MMSRKLLILLNWQDHGYSLGELNLNWDKRNVYDFDIRIHRASLAPSFLVLRALVLTRQFARA